MPRYLALVLTVVLPALPVAFGQKPKPDSANPPVRFDKREVETGYSEAREAPATEWPRLIYHATSRPYSALPSSRTLRLIVRTCSRCPNA
jgi:hypothetical protein